MRNANLSLLAIAPLLGILASPSSSFGQGPPSQPITVNFQKSKQPPDEFKAILNVIEDAYKAPYEVDKDVLDELRKQYRNPTLEREAKILREVRRLYVTTPEREEAILREVRRACELQTSQQEERIFQEIRKGGRVPLGSVQQHSQVDYATRMFTRLDQDANGSLHDAELTDQLREQRAKWDRNNDRLINLEEYSAYYQANLKSISEKVASGEIYLKAAQPAQPSGTATTATPAPARVEDSRPSISRFGKLPQGLPDWFVKLDKEGDNDGQVGLYEWKFSQKTLSEFASMDLNSDGLLTAEEYLRWKAVQSKKTGGEQLAANEASSSQGLGQTSGSEKRFGPPNPPDNGSGRFGQPSNGFGPPMGGFGPPMNGSGRFGLPKGGFGPPKSGDSGSRFGQPKDGSQNGDKPSGKMFRKKG